jgi:hypothetical protein
VIPDAAVGRVLMFDPTDPVTPVGDLPKPEQASFALLVAPNRGGLITMPILPAAANRMESTVEASVGPDGRMEAHIARDYYGQSGIALREIQKTQGDEEVKKGFERALSRRLNGLSVKKIATVVKEENRLAVDIDLAADNFAQVMQNRLFILRPGFLTSGGDYFFNARTRTAPIRLQSDLRRDSIHIKLPVGFKLDELPGASKIESPYGRLEATWTMHDQEIVMEETLEVKETVASASDYAAVRDFFDQVSGAQAAPLVLVRQ